MKRFALFIVSAIVAVAQQNTVKTNPFHEAAVNLAKGETQPATKKGRATTAPVKQPDFTGSIVAKREIPVLPESARVGLALSDTLQKQGIPPVASPDGRLLWVYGHSNPVIVCSIFQICQIYLKPGERLSGEPGKEALDIGDNRFNVEKRIAGTGPDEYQYLIVKPKERDLKTNLVVGTNERSYYLNLISTDKENMPRVAFTYPDDEARKDQELRDQVRAKEEAARIKAEEDAKLAKASTMREAKNWNYTLSFHGKDSEYLRPLFIRDDGVHTKITMNPDTRYRGLPVVQVSDSRGVIPANARWDGDTLVIDAVFKHGCLMSGTGRKQQRVCIDNGDLQ